MRTYEDWKRALQGRRLPAMVVDLDAMDHNLGVMLRAMAPGPTLRIATKSLRVPAVVEALLGRHDRLRGLMTFRASETLLYAERGVEDLLLAYPVARPDEAVALATAAARGATVRVVVDHPAQARLLSDAAVGAGVRIGLCVDVDVSWRPRVAAGRLHLGVRRSPIRSAEAAVALVRELRRLDGVHVDSLMAYEAQVAGLPDHSPGGGPLDAVKRGIKARSRGLASSRRLQVAAALEAEGVALTVINGGGTGSLASTSSDGSVTEVTAGSGFFCPRLFDGYDGLELRPAAFFALAVARFSDPGFLTAAGGGFIASGPVGADRAPEVHAPRGLAPVGMEGFGEVQTPFTAGPEAPELALGDPVICRHAKAGELAEHFTEALLMRGGEVVEAVPTLRGLGH